MDMDAIEAVFGTEPTVSTATFRGMLVIMSFPHVTYLYYISSFSTHVDIKYASRCWNIRWSGTNGKSVRSAK